MYTFDVALHHAVLSVSVGCTHCLTKILTSTEPCTLAVHSRYFTAYLCYVLVSFITCFCLCVTCPIYIMTVAKYNLKCIPNINIHLHGKVSFFEKSKTFLCSKKLIYWRTQDISAT